jgi:hypothetical protein
VPSSTTPNVTRAPETTADPDVPNVEIGTDLVALPSGPAVPYEVDGRPLPTAVVSAYLSRGGQLLRNDDVLGALDLREFPYPSAVGVVVTDATVSVNATDSGAVDREDALGWLFVEDDTIGEIIDGLARKAGLDVAGWRRTESSPNVMGSECLEATYTSELAPVTWKLSGCSYREFAGLRAVQVQRYGSFFAADLAPIAAVADHLTGTALLTNTAGLALAGWSLDFTQPEATGSTSVVSLRFRSPNDPTGALRAALSTWTEIPADEDHGLRFRAADDEWEVSPAGAVFTHHDRFPA